MTTYNQLELKLSFEIIIEIVKMLPYWNNISIIGIMEIKSHLHDLGMGFDHAYQALLIVMEH